MKKTTTPSSRTYASTNPQTQQPTNHQTRTTHQPTNQYTHQAVANAIDDSGARRRIFSRALHQAVRAATSTRARARLQATPVGTRVDHFSGPRVTAAKTGEPSALQSTEETRIPLAHFFFRVFLVSLTRSVVMRPSPGRALPWGNANISRLCLYALSYVLCAESESAAAPDMLGAM